MNTNRFYSAEFLKQDYEPETDYEKQNEDWLRLLCELTDIAFGRSPITLTSLPLFDSSLLFGFTNKEMIISALKRVSQSYNFELSLNSIKKIQSPMRYIFGTDDFNMDVYTSYISKAPVKYLSNFDAYMIQKDATEITSLSGKTCYDLQSTERFSSRIIYRNKRYSGDELLKLLREAVLMRHFVNKYSISRRLLPLHKLIQIVFESSNFSSERGFSWQDNPILITLNLLYSPYRDFPFREVENMTEFTASASMLLPELSFALIELWFKYVLIDMTQEELIVGINVLLEWSETSLDERLLKFKDARTNVSKVLIDSAIEIRGIKHGYRGLEGVIYEKSPTEIWMLENREEAEDFIAYTKDFVENAPIALLSYLRKIGLISENTFSSTRMISGLVEVKRLYTVINVICQHGLFIKNPVILTIQKSILPRGSIALAPKEAIIMKNAQIFSSPLTYQLKWELTPIFREMLYEGRKLLDAYADKYNKLDLEAEFIKALTNNSGGVEYEPTEKEAVDIPISVLKAFGKKRVMYFLLNPILYESYSAWIESLKSVTNSGERKQVDRRGRVIQMVSNAAQLAPFLLFLWADIMGKSEPELSSKKNTGTIKDLNALLRSTGSLDSVQESADISGMDASTSRVATSFINGLLVNLLDKCTHERYFFSTRQLWNLYRSNNESEEFLESKELHPGIPVVQISEFISESYNYKLTIPELSAFGMKVVMDTSAHVFPSGKFSTNAQHSILNMLILRVFKKFLHIELLKKKIPVFTLEVKVSGDDIYAAFRIVQQNDDVKRMFSAELLRIFTQVGFKIGSLLSRYGATFLQQSALFGTVLPKPDRISITTSERGDSLKLSAFDAFSEVRDIMKELCGRVHYPSNVTGILVLIANQLRRIRINISLFDSAFREKLKLLKYQLHHESLKYLQSVGDNCSHYLRRLLVGKDYAHIILPFMSLFVSDGFDITPLATFFHRYVSRSNVFTPRGSIGDWKLRQALIVKGCEQDDYLLTPEVMTSFQSLASATSNVNSIIADLRKHNDLLQQSILRYLNNRYDHNLARYLGMSWLTHFNKFNVTEVLERIRLAKFPKHVVEDWAQRLAFRLNFDAIVRSKLAGLRLERAGYKLSKRLAFYNTPHERVLQAITSGGDSLQEFRLHRTELLFHMIEFKCNGNWLKDVEYETVLLQRYTVERSESLHITREAVIDIYGGLMLSSGQDQDRDFILHKFGHNFYDLSVQFSGYYALVPGPFKDYKHEDLVKFASKVFHENPSLLIHVWEFANVHPRYQAELEKIIRFGEASELSPWKSIVHTRQCFELSSSVRQVRLIWSPITSFDTRIDRLLLVIMRDIACSQNDILFSRAKLQLSHAFLLIHGGLRSKINSLLVLSRSS